MKDLAKFKPSGASKFNLAEYTNFIGRFLTLTTGGGGGSYDDGEGELAG